MGLLTSSFFKREDIWYFVPNEIIGFQLVDRERNELRARMTMQLALNLLLSFSTLVLAHYSIGPWFSPQAMPAVSWLPQTGILYLIVVLAWMLCWANSLLLWRTVRKRIARRETRIAQEAGQSGFLRCTRPLQTAMMAVFVVGFLTQGFGTICVVHDVAPVCAVIDTVLSIRL